MNNYEVRCKGCGKKLLTYNEGSFRKYKSPLKQCKKCGAKYLDPRCHEIAIEGIPSDSFSVTSYLILLIFGAFILYRGIYLFGRHQLGVIEEIQWLLPAVFVIGGGIMVIGGIIEIISIISGSKCRKFDRLKMESEERLADNSYAYQLKELGYNVPERYL